MKRIYSVFLILLFYNYCYGIPFHNIQHLGIKEGLSNNYVVSIAQDKKGFLWFATEEGLNKFDGSRFIPFYKENGKSHGINGNELNCLLDDPKDSILWIGTQRAGINAYNYSNNTFKSYQHNANEQSSLITNDITNIFASSDGNIWICTFWKGIDYFDKEKEQFIHYNTNTVSGLGSDHIWSLSEGKNNQLYIGHANEGFSILSIKEKTAKNYRHIPEDPHSIPGNEVTCIYRDKNEHIWIGTNHGLALFIPHLDRFISLGKFHKELSNRVHDIKQINENKLWIALEFGGIAIIDLSQALFQSFNNLQLSIIKGDNAPYGLSNSSIRCLQQDSFGNVWAGSWGGGINFIPQTPQRFNHYSYSPHSLNKNTLTNKIALSLCVDSEERLWIGTDGNGINIFKNNQKVTVYNTSNSKLSSNIIQASFCDSKGGLWFGSFYKGISYYNPKTKQFYQIQDLGNEDIRFFYEAENGNIWAATSNGIMVIDQGSLQLKKHYLLENNLTRCLIQDTQKRTWVGFYGAGLGIYDSNMQLIKLFNVDNQFPSNTINSIYQDSQQRIWIATGEGLVCFNSPEKDIHTYQIYQRNNGLANAHIHSIIEDRKGNIWFSTNKGISCLIDKENICYNFDYRDNLPLGSFNSRSLAWDKNKNLYFGSIDGVCYFNPEIVLQEQKAPLAIINSIEINNTVQNIKDNPQKIIIDGTSNITLNHTQNYFQIRFNILDYNLVNQVEYAYMLKGLNDTWYPITDPNSVTFRNLAPGSYTFYIKTRIRNQKWSEDMTSLNIRISPPIWLTWWSKLGYIIIVLSIIVYILYLYNKHVKTQSLYKLEKQNHEKEQELNNERLRFFTNITHELRTPLTLILGPLEDLINDSQLPEKYNNRIRLIHGSALRLLKLINQILEFRKTETQNRKLSIIKGDLTNIVTEIGLRFKELNRNKNVKIIMDIEKDLDSVYFDTEIITTVLNNLLSNAIKYTPEGEILLSLHRAEKKNEKYFEIIVSDTGYGIEPEVLPHIFERYYQSEGKHQASGTGIGLALVKALADIHKAHLEVKSKLGEGTQFIFSIHADNIYSETPQKEIALISKKECKEKDNRQIILVVEDNDDIRDYITTSFNLDYQVIDATNGKEGLNQVFKYIPDIIICDIMMPIMDGLELCKVIKEDIRSCHIPIILLTAKDSQHEQKEGYEYGADSYLTKPFSVSILRSRIENLLENQKKLIRHLNLNYHQENITDDGAIHPNELDNEFLMKINHLIEDRLEFEKIDIGYLSDKMCMSSSTLYRKMKALTGMSTNEYIRKIRMKYAKKYLTEGIYNISEITYKVGMNSLFYFRQCFKEEFGCTPSEYLQNINKTNHHSKNKDNDNSKLQ